MKAARERLISDIDHVAEFGHPAIDRQDDAAASNGSGLKLDEYMEDQ